MLKQTKIVVLATLTIAVLTSASGGVARAADDCIAKPNKQPPDGSHWYYRTDRAAGRKCWYLADEDESTVDASASKRRAAAKSASTETASSAPKQAVENARAELVETPRAEAPAPRVAAAKPEPSPVVTAPPVVTAKVAAADPREWTIASRWLNPATMTVAVREDTPVSDPAPTVAPAAAPAAAPDTRPQLSTPESVAAIQQQAEAPESPDVLLFVMAGCAFVFVVVLGGLIIRLVHTRQLDALDLAQRRVERWDDEAEGGGMHGHGRPSPRFAATASLAPAPAQRRPQRRPFNEEVEELERLLENTRRVGALR